MSEGKELKLCHVQKDNVTIGDTLDWCSDYFPDEKALPALVYSPTICRFVLLGRDGVARDEKGNTCPLDNSFELRLFCIQWEMRWLRDGEKGQAVLVWDSESDFVKAPDNPQELDVFKILDNNSYLLWGEYMETDNTVQEGWTLLAEARIGSVWVPWSVKEAGDHSRIKLESKEYMAVFAHGNVAVMAERLTGFSHEAPLKRRREKQDA